MKSNEKPQGDREVGKKKPGVINTGQLKEMHTKIQEAEGRFQAIIDNSPDGMVILNPTENAEGPWLIEDCNRSFCEMNGFERSELIGKDIRMVSNETATEVELPNKYHEKITERKGTVETHRRSYYQRLKKGAIRLEEVHKRKDGSTFLVQASSCVVTLGGQERVLGIDRDITEDTQREEMLLASEERYRSLFENSPISLWEEDFSAVKLCIDDLRKQGTKDFRTFFENHPEVVTQCMNQIRVVDVNKATLKMFAAKSKAEIVKNLSVIINKNHEDMMEELVNISEGTTDFEWQGINFTLAGEGRLVSLHWSVAPGHEDTLNKIFISMIDITKRKQVEETLVHQTEELRLRNEELERLYHATGSLLSNLPFNMQTMAKTIAEEVVKNFSYASCSIFMISKDLNDLDQLAMVGSYSDQGRKVVLTVDGARQVPQAIRSGQVINTSDVRSVSAHVPGWELAQSELTVPLKIGNQVIGAIDVQSTEPGAFKPEDERLITFFAERAAMALERGRLNEELERRILQLNSLRAVDLAISGSMDIKLTLGILLDQLTKHLGIDAADVLLFNPALQNFTYNTGQGFHTHALQYTNLNMDSGYAGRAARERQIITIQNLPENSGELQRSAEFSLEGFMTYLGVPLIAKGQIKGVLEIFQRQELKLDKEQHTFLDMLAGQAAIAIDNAQLFENLQGSNFELMMAYDETIEGWSRAMDLRDKETEGHTQRVTELTLRLAASLGLGAKEMPHIRRGALLHDIGKIGVPDDILHKPGPLTDEEWLIMRKHPKVAHDMLISINYLQPALDIPYCHHEKWDGTGYPLGLKGEQIPIAARIFSVVDVWDALLSDRPYRKAWPEDKVRQYIQEQASIYFDPHIVDVFLKMVPNGK